MIKDNEYINIIASQEELKFEINILKEEENDDDENDDDKNDIKLTMTITLYQGNNGHILQFVRKEGAINDFNHYVQMLSEFVKDLLES